MKLPKVRYFHPRFRLKSFLEWKLFINCQSLDSYMDTWNPLFPNYINLDLLRYLLSIGSHVACRIYCYNGFKDCILVSDDNGIPFSDINRIERSSRFKVKIDFTILGKIF